MRAKKLVGEDGQFRIMTITLGELAGESTCAIYNDLSHMNPRYLTPAHYPAFYQDEELNYHKRNLILLSLFFDKIIISIENLTSSTRFLSQDIVAKVATAPWFRALVEQQIIVLAGWGFSENENMLANQLSYSRIYRPELRSTEYLETVADIAEQSSWVIRESATTETCHILKLRPLLRSLETVFGKQDYAFIQELVEQTNDTLGYLGTLDLYPFIDELFGDDTKKSDAFYRTYYQSWHEYCGEYYSPVIPIHTSRIPLPHTYVQLKAGERPALAMLFSPDLFHRYLLQRFDHRLVGRLLAIDPYRLAEIRNGDWLNFKTKYHAALQAAAGVSWILHHPDAHNLLASDASIDLLVADVFSSVTIDTEVSAFGNAIDLVLGLALGATGAAPGIALLERRLKRRVHSLFSGALWSRREPYLRKLHRLLKQSNDSPTRLSAA